MKTMRQKITTLALMALITSTAFAGFNAPLPEFKTPEQLAEWRAELAAKSDSKTSTTTQDTAFYTGKPYVESTGSYAFKYRAYNPELARWTSEDPSGFPDGVNGNIYAPTPTSEFDFMGLLTIAGSRDGATSHYYTPSDPLGNGYTVESEDLTDLSASSFNSSFAGWTFSAGSLDATMKISGYNPNAFSTYGQCTLMANILDVPRFTLGTGEQFCWVQVVTCNVEGSGGVRGTFLDIAPGQTTPFYAGNADHDRFTDGPHRDYAQLKDVEGGGPISWKGELYYGKFSNQNVILFGGVTWEFSIYE